MKLFTNLFNEIDSSTKTNIKVEALVHYFQLVSEEDILYAIALLIGNRPRRPVKTSQLKLWAAEMSHIPSWLFDDCYYIAGDLAETITLLLKEHPSSHNESLHDVIKALQQTALLSDEEKKNVITNYWQRFTGNELFVFNKLITGNFRMGVSKQLVVKALAKFLQSDETKIAHQLMGKWNPAEETLATLFSDDITADKHYQPYPFYLAYPLEDDIHTLGDINDWILEAKLDGIRGQIIYRANELYVWSRGEDLLTDKFPEFEKLKNSLPAGTVIDGEIIPFKDNRFLSFNELQTRIGRKNITTKILTEVPVVMVCFDLLEWNGEDIRHQPLSYRRELLENVVKNFNENKILILSQSLHFDKWNEAANYRINARQYGTEGLMLKQKNSPYETGRKRGNWWKWKTGPMTIDGVLLYAQSGHGRRANLFTDYTFAVWDEQKKLLPFTKAYSGLTDKEIIEMDNWIKRNTIEKFGPVRSVKPYHVFEIAFEGIAESTRHKSGVALRFPRILRWRKDKHAEEANTVEELRSLLKNNNHE
ncbi:MAG: ATP-dependent DNA ligase [Arachidicoccus sp.]|nr:ATP-dependent DNA ligase [Arachidicoccus sp.]